MCIRDRLKRAPQKLSFCFKCPDIGTVRILGNILYQESNFSSPRSAKQLGESFMILNSVHYVNLKQAKENLETKLLLLVFFSKMSTFVTETSFQFKE